MFPCPTSHNQGQHKWAGLRFTSRARDKFMQACRYCGTVRYGSMVVLDDGKVDTIWSHSRSDGLENGSSEPANPKDISTETGNID